MGSERGFHGRPERDELTPLQNAIYLLKQTQAKLAAYERAQVGTDRHYRRGLPLSRGAATRSRFGESSPTASTPSAKSRPTAGTSTTSTIRIPPRRAR